MKEKGDNFVIPGDEKDWRCLWKRWIWSNAKNLVKRSFSFFALLVPKANFEVETYFFFFVETYFFPA
jgi:hypothetical protein